MRFRAVPPFRYMAWAKEHIVRGARFPLAASGLAPPPEDMLPLDRVAIDLGHRGKDMPPEARARVAERLGVDPACVMLTLGTSHAMYLLCATKLEPGDVCLVERPAYEMLATLPELFGARVQRFERRFEDGWRLPEELPALVARHRPAMVIFSNPHNPTGVLADAAVVRAVVDAAAAVEALVAVDEVYLEYVPDARRHSAFGMPGVASASSLTKAYGLGTARFGWILGAAPIIEATLRYNNYVSVLYPNPSAAVGLAALERLDALKERAQRVQQANGAVLAEWIDGRADVAWRAPDAGVIAFLELGRVKSTMAFCERLLAERSTLLVPGEFFEAPGFVRLGFGCDEAILREGLAELGKALDQAGA